MSNPSDKTDFEELADMLDECVGKGSGHINVKAGKIGRIINIATAACEGGACSAPTLHRDIDD